MLFTWGGSFSLSEGVGGGGSGGAKVDTHKGCLGTGDKEGRLVPTRVIGELENQVVIQVGNPILVSISIIPSSHIIYDPPLSLPMLNHLLDCSEMPTSLLS